MRKLKRFRHIKTGESYPYPALGFAHGEGCVYALFYESGHLYIGGTSNFSSRMSGHNKSYVSGAGKAVSVKILEIIPKRGDILKIERKYISKEANNPLLLNIQDRIKRCAVIKREPCSIPVLVKSAIKNGLIK